MTLYYEAIITFCGFRGYFPIRILSNYKFFSGRLKNMEVLLRWQGVAVAALARCQWSFCQVDRTGQFLLADASGL